MTDADAIIARRDRLRADRGVWESHWQEIADRVLPRQASFVTRRTPGEKRTREIFDATAALGLERFAAALESMLTPRAQRWHHLRASDPALNDLPDMRAWFDRAEEVLFAARYAPHANYASQQHEVYMSLGAFGTGVLFVGEDEARNGLIYRAVHLADCAIGENFQGRIDTLYRDFDYTDNDPFPAETHERGLDRVTMMAQDSADAVDRALRYPDTDSTSLSSELPNSISRASKFLAFDASGNPIASSGPTGDSSIPVSSYIETLLDDVDAPTARTTLGAQADLDVPSQAEAEAGTATTERVWTAERVGQAIAAQAGFASVQVITASTTWNKPAGITTVLIELAGGGGAGGGASATGASEAAVGSGGGGGGYRAALLDVSAISSSTVTVGAGGAGVSGGTGGNGGDTVWSDGTNTVTAKGGLGGVNSGNTAGTTNAAGGAGGGAGSGGDYGVVGDDGQNGDIITGLPLSGNDGGNAGRGFGSSTRAPTGNADGNAGKSFGGGGTGARNSGSQPTRTGGAGAAGVVIVWEFK